jgi:glycosyltransferase involved in cell wall biosynthesis
VLVVAYESSAFIEQLLDRIPARLEAADHLVLVSDDHSSDDTADLAEKWAVNHPDLEVVVLRQPRNLGYGGNQKATYRWARERGVDVGVLLHGDEQYPPERIDELVAPVLAGRADAVHGSRMIIRGGARGGGMPLNRFLGNRTLSWLLNRLSGASLTEWFSGFRAYRIEAVMGLDLDSMPDGFDFDTSVTLGLLADRRTIAEVAIPTRYAHEISRVPLLRTGLAAVRHGVDARRRRPVQSRTSSST